MGRRFNADPDNAVPPPRRYSLVESGGTVFVRIGFDLADLWPYRNIEIVAASRSMFSAFGTKDDDVVMG